MTSLLQDGLLTSTAHDKQKVLLSTAVCSYRCVCN